MTQMASNLDMVLQNSEEPSQDLLKAYMEQYMGVENFDEMSEQESLEKAKEAFQHLVNNFQQLSAATQKLESQLSPTKESNSRPGTSQKQEVNFQIMKDTQNSIIRIQAWWRQKMTIKLLESDLKQAKETFNNRRQNETPEESALKEFATQLNRKNLTPEAFFRLCDPDYKMVVEISAFKNQLNKLGIQLSRGQISRMTMILDEELDGVIEREDFYDALEAYSVAGEKHKNVDGSPYYPFQNRSLFKLIIELQKKDISHVEMFNACDIDDNSRVDISEIRRFVEGLSSSFNQKEIFSLMNFLDIDKNGLIDRDEFIRGMKKGEQSYQQSIVVAKQTAQKKMQPSASLNLLQSRGGDSRFQSQQYVAQENNYFEEEEMGEGDQNFASNFFTSAKSKAESVYQQAQSTYTQVAGSTQNAYQKVAGYVGNQGSSTNSKLTPDEQKRAMIVQKMEREGQSFQSFFASLKAQSVQGKLTLGVVLKALEVSYPTITQVDRNYLVRDCIVEKTKIDYMLLEEVFTRYSKKLKPSVAQAFLVIATNIMKKMGGPPEQSIKQFFKAQAVSENDVLSDMEFSTMFSGKFSNLSQADLDQAFNSLNLDMDGFVHVRDIIEVLLSYSSTQERNATTVNDLNSVIPGFESMSPRTRSQEVIEYLIAQLAKKSMAPINVYKMADSKNSGSVQVQILEQTFKKFLASVKNEVFQEAMHAFGELGPRDMITRSDFETVFTVDQKGGYIPNSSGIGKKSQTSTTITKSAQKDVPLDEATIWIRKLDNAMLKEGVSPQVAFKAADTNYNSVVTVGELREAMKKFIPEETLSLGDLKKIMLAFDKNKNGLIEEQEFIDMISEARNANVTIIESPTKSKQGVGMEDRRSQLPLKDSKGGMSATTKSNMEQDDSLITQQMDVLDKKVNLKQIFGELLINEEGKIMINSIGRRLKQETKIRPSDYLPLLGALDKGSTGMVDCKEILKFCEKYCKSNSTNYILEVKWIANVIEFQKHNRNTKQYFETNTKMKSGTRLMEVELMSELQKNFGISMQAGRQIYKGLNINGGDVTLDDFCTFVDKYRQVAAVDPKQVSTSASKLNADIILSKFWLRIYGLLPKIKEQLDSKLGYIAQTEGQIIYKDFYDIMVGEFDIITIPESKALFEFFRSKGQLKNAIEVDIFQQMQQDFSNNLRQAQFFAIGQVIAGLGAKFQDTLTKVKMNENGFVSKNDLRIQLQTLGVITKKGENDQASKYSIALKKELNLSNEFDLPSQVQSCDAFDSEFQSQNENCQFWTVVQFLSQLSNICCDELIFKFLGKVFDAVLQKQISATLIQQASPNILAISNASELVQIISKIQDYASKKIKSLAHGQIDDHSSKMIQQLWPILGGKPIKITATDDNVLLKKINRHRALLAVGGGGYNNDNDNDVSNDSKGQNKSDLMKQSINQREPINSNSQDSQLLEQLEAQLGITLEKALDIYLLEDVVPYLSFMKTLSDVNKNVSKELLRTLCREIDTQDLGKILVKDLIIYFKNKTNKYDQEEIIQRIAADVDDPVLETLQKNNFFPNDILTLPDFYEQLTAISNVSKLSACCLFYGLLENEEDYFSIQVNKFSFEIQNAKKGGNKKSKASFAAVVKQPAVNKKIDFDKAIETKEAVKEEVKAAPSNVKTLGKKEVTVSNARTNVEIIDREQEKIEKSKELCGRLVDMWQVIYKAQVIKSALLKINKNLSVCGSVNEAQKQLDPKNEGQITIYKIYKQLGQYANMTEQEKIILCFLPLNYFQGSSLMVMSRDYVKMIRKITSNENMTPYGQALKKVYKEIKQEVEDERAGIAHETSENEEGDRNERIKRDLKDVLSQLVVAMKNMKLNKAMEDQFTLQNEGKLDYFDFIEFLEIVLKIQTTEGKLNALCLEIDQDGGNSVTAQSFARFCEDFDINFYMDTTIFQDDKKDDENGQGETLFCEDLVYTIVPKEDYFREGVSTILNSESAALVMAQKLYDAIPDGQDYLDLDFGPKNDKDLVGNQMSLYNTGEPPTNYIRPTDVQWIGPEKWSPKRPKFLDAGASSGDVQQGNIGDCWFISALSVIATREELLRGGMQNIDIQKGMKINKEMAEDLCSGVYPPIFHMYRKKGLYVMRFFKDFIWRYVIIDERIPCFKSNMEPVFGKCANIWEIWVPLIEKAYAKLNGSYESLISGFIDDALNEMTGLVSEKIKLNDPKTGLIHPSLGSNDLFWKTLLDRKKEYCMMGCSIVGGTEEKFKIDGRPCGIITGHAYAILDIFELTEPKTREVFKIVLIRNPWGNTEWNGSWSDQSQEIVTYKKLLDKYIASLEPEERFVIGEDDGTFMMDYESFLSVYNNMFICVDFPLSWTALRIKSEWNSNFSAGLPSPATPAKKLAWATNNPQFYIAPTTDIELFISLAQPDGRAKRGTQFFKFPYAEVIHPVQFTVCQLKDPNSKRIDNFDTSNQIFRSVVKEHREISARIKLPKGRYVIVCSTRNTGEQGPFFLSLYFDKPAGSIKFQDLQNKKNLFLPIQEEDENLNKVQRWKRDLCIKRLDFMLNKEDEEIGDILDASQEKSFLGMSQTIAFGQNGLDVQPTTKIVANNKTPIVTYNKNQQQQQQQQPVQPVISKVAQQNKNVQPVVKGNQPTVNAQQAKNTQQNTQVQQKQPAGKQPAAKNVVTSTAGKKVGFQTEDFE